LTHPDRYAAAASLSGALNVVHLAQAEEEVGGGELKHIFGDVSRLPNGPNDLFHLAERLARRVNLAVGPPYRCAG